VTRRFLTAEDVRRLAEGGRVVVDAETVVTPQARETAREAGVDIVSGSGAHTDPTPDRGPDASRAARTLPNMPEPTGPGSSSFVVTVVGLNRSGVLADVTRVLAELDVNVNDISQRIVEGYFHLILTCDLSAQGRFEEAKARLEGMSGGELVVRVMNGRVFQFMHRV
jgi:ACT domain-containing protein